MTNKEKNRIKNAKSKEYRTSYKKKIYQQCREYCWEYKRTHPCMHCGEKHPACLSFHHRDPSTKDGDVTYLCKYGMKRVEQKLPNAIYFVIIVMPRFIIIKGMPSLKIRE